MVAALVAFINRHRSPAPSRDEICLTPRETARLIVLLVLLVVVPVVATLLAMTLAVLAATLRMTASAVVAGTIAAWSSVTILVGGYALWIQILRPLKRPLDRALWTVLFGWSRP